MPFWRTGASGCERPGRIDKWVDARIQGGLGGQWRGLQYLLLPALDEARIAYRVAEEPPSPSDEAMISARVSPSTMTFTF